MGLESSAAIGSPRPFPTWGFTPQVGFQLMYWILHECKTIHIALISKYVSKASAEGRSIRREPHLRAMP